MPRLLYLYLAKRIAVSALVIEASLCIPVVMTSLFHYLPPAAVRAGLLWPALLGTMPTVLYVALPMAVGVAIALEFSRMTSDGMIAVLYSLRLSVWSIATPSCGVAVIAVAAGLWLSSFFAPSHVGEMQDVIHIIRNSLNHRMLEPARFYTFDGGSRTMYFQRWRSADVVSGMFIYQFDAAKNEEQIITAAETEFRRNEQSVVMILSNGSIQTRSEGGSAIRTTNFDEYVIPMEMQGAGAMPKRGWRGAFEMPFWEFFHSIPPERDGPRRFAEWMSEATKRCGIPLLALAHAMLAIGLVLNLSAATGRSSAAAPAIVLMIPAVHVAILIGAETLVRQDPRFVWLVGIAILAEFAVAIWLLHRRNADFPARRSKA
ncbi:LptF/LptG family permease [Methylocapsa palsarum]|uniref:Lipopolysaccharide export system permease protein n=1 Tax=Methylocapsa palsarum TaxID=1612308 RepID=A0A1I3XGT8_9HYPH|nr:LptF/LptG family permease [Methylocapsa palsarum]SFK18787.1 lipopolysaccharide export system permease protein [Methylocapsa palsarum]